jgi:hypothetical protein
MPFNGSGTFVRLYNWVTDKNNGVPITASRFDGEDDDFAAGLSQCLTRDGQGTPTGPLNVATQRIINVADPTALTDAVNVRSMINDVGVWGTAVAGTANAQTVSTLIPGAPLVAGQQINYMPLTANTGPATLNVNGTGARPVTFIGHALTGGELGVGIKAELIYDGSNWQLVSVPANYASGGGGGIPEAPNDGTGYVRQSLAWTHTPAFLVGATVSADPTTALGLATKQYVDAQVASGTLVAIRPFNASQTPYVPSGGVNSIHILLQAPGGGGGGVGSPGAGQLAIGSAGGAGETRWASYSGSANITGQNLILPAGGVGGAAGGANAGATPADATFGTSSLPGGQLIAAAGHGGAGGSIVSYTSDGWFGNSTSGGNSGNAGYASRPGGPGSPTCIFGWIGACCRGGPSYFSPSPPVLLALTGAGGPVANNAVNWGGGGDGGLAMQNGTAMKGGNGGQAFALIFEFT